MNKNEKQSQKLKASQSTVDGLVYIKQMIKNNINSFFEFTPIHPETLYYITTLSNEQINHYLKQLNFITLSSSHLRVPSAKEYISFFLCLILHFYSKEDITDSSKYILILFEVILKLYSSSLLSKEEVSIIALFLIVLSIEPRRELFCKSIKDMSFTDISNKRIKNFEIFYLSMELVIKANNPDITSTCCDFCLNKVIKNKTNLFYITKEAKILSLLEITSSDKQIEFLTKIYMSKYSKIFLNYFLKNIRIALESPNDIIQTILPVIKNQTDLLNYINTEEIDNLDKDMMLLNRGFVMNNTPSNGMSVNNIKIKNQFTLLFSFNFSPNANCYGDEEYPIISLKPEMQSEQIISFYIAKGQLILSALDYKNRIICNIKMNTTYLVYFQLKDRDQFVLFIKSKTFQWSEKNTTKTVLKKEFTMEIGKDNKNNFEGYIGSVLMFKTIFPDDFRCGFFELKGNYDSIFYLPLYETSHIEKFNKELNNTSNENEEFHNALKYFKTNKETIKNIICFVAPPNQNQFDKGTKKVFSNFFFKDMRLKFKCEPIVQNDGTYCFENINMIFEFLKYEGLYFLILNYELYTKLISMSNLSQELYNLIENNICSLFDFTIEIFNQINFEVYIKEIKKLLFSIQKYVHIVSNRFT